MSARFETVDTTTITALVHEFYARVRRHPTLGPVFADNIAGDEWPAHLSKMCRFWSAVMLTNGAYSGNPVAVHRAVAGMDKALFPQWIELFEATAADLFTPDQAEAFTTKARRIAASLEMTVFFRVEARPSRDELARPVGA
jgi:hemoglobin